MEAGTEITVQYTGPGMSWDENNRDAVLGLLRSDQEGWTGRLRAVLGSQKHTGFWRGNLRADLVAGDAYYLEMVVIHANGTSGVSGFSNAFSIRGSALDSTTFVSVPSSADFHCGPHALPSACLLSEDCTSIRCEPPANKSLAMYLDQFDLTVAFISCPLKAEAFFIKAADGLALSFHGTVLSQHLVPNDEGGKDYAVLFHNTTINGSSLSLDVYVGRKFDGFDEFVLYEMLVGAKLNNPDLRDICAQTSASSELPTPTPAVEVLQPDEPNPTPPPTPTQDVSGGTTISQQSKLALGLGIGLGGGIVIAGSCFAFGFFLHRRQSRSSQA